MQVRTYLCSTYVSIESITNQSSFLFQLILCVTTVGNRAEWEAHGQQIVEEMINEFKGITNQKQEHIID